MVELDYTLLSLTIIGSIFAGIVSSLIVQVIIKKVEKNGIISNIKKAIKQEIQENVESIKDFKITTKKMEDGTKESELKYLTIASYDSTVKSGDFILLSTELRQEISELYTYIHVANFESDQLIKSQYIMAEDNDKFEKLILRQLGVLTKSYQVIKTKSKILLKKL